MDRIDAMRVFARIVERRSFVRAAEDMGLPASTATDAVKQLERRLGVRLLDRTTRQVRPTLDGESYYRHCVNILDEIEEAESVLSDAQPRGLLRVNMLGTHARQIVLPALPAFLDRYPKLNMHLSEADRFVDLVREGIDCVIRAGQLHQSDLVGRQIALLKEVTVVSPDYIVRFGNPAHLDELEGHQMVGFHSSTTGGVMPLEFIVEGRPRNVTLPARLMVSGTDTLRQAALRGLGIIQVPRYSVAGDIADGRLIEILPHNAPEPMPVHVLYPSSRQLSLRVRVFIDWVVDLFKQRDAAYEKS
ncbi:MAG: LysR family transcriptional regulator [Mesorhizobium sp.]